MVTFPPYLASSGWYCRWLRQLTADTHGNEEPAETYGSQFHSREYARTTILDAHQSPMLLSMAVEGGARSLRDISQLNSIRLSDHGNWRRNHILAIEAAYGRTPFFHLIADKILEVYKDESIVTLRNFNIALHYLISQQLFINLEPKRLHHLAVNEEIIKRGKELAKEIKPEISVLDPLMKLGPEAITGIFALYI